MTVIDLSGAALPARPGDVEHPLLSHTRGWLHAQTSLHTKNAYRRDVIGFGATGQPAIMKTPAWLPWCEQNGLDPLAVTISHVNAYGDLLTSDGHSPATRARKLSAVSSWYAYLIKAEVATRNPASDATRPWVDRLTSPATGLSQDEMQALFTQAAHGVPGSLALIAMLYFGAFRIGSVLAASVGDLGWDQGERTLRLVLKGRDGGAVRDVLEAPAAAALDGYLRARGNPPPSAPLFPGADGKRMTAPAAWRLVRRLAREAGIKSWAQLNPHSLRHTHITHALDEQVPVEVIQNTAHHRQIETTLRYDRARQGRNRSGRALAEMWKERLQPGEAS